MTHLVAAPDKFRGTATSREVAQAAGRAARAAGLSADLVPLSDGGEGLLEAVGGEVRTTTVSGPLGGTVEARWRLQRQGGDGPVAVIEMAEASGRHLVPHPGGDDPVRASTAGVGELIVAAVVAGARRVVVGCGGSATTDGGIGAVEAVRAAGITLAHGRGDGPELVVACDVTTPFRRAAAVFGPQKGATPLQVEELTARLARLADRYRDEFGVEVDALPGSGAAGGLGGGLAALGGRLVPGLELVASLVDLYPRLARADLVVTGEGHLDAPSLQGKVVGGVLAAVDRRVPVLCVVGDADPEVAARVAGGDGAPTEVVRLVEVAGPERARRETAALVERVVSDWLGRRAGGDLAPARQREP